MSAHTLVIGLESENPSAAKEAAESRENDSSQAKARSE